MSPHTAIHTKMGTMRTQNHLTSTIEWMKSKFNWRKEIKVFIKAKWEGNLKEKEKKVQSGGKGGINSMEEKKRNDFGKK